MSKVNGKITVMLDKKRTMVMDYNAIAEAEDILNKPFPSINVANMGVRDIRALIYASMVTVDQDVTLKLVGELMTNYTEPLLEAFADVMNSAFPEGDIKKPNTKKPKQSTKK